MSFENSTVQVNGGAIARRFRVNYTAKTINATAGSRTAIATDLAVGDVLVQDPYGPDKGKGADFTQPQTSFLTGQRVVVVEVPPSINDIPDSVGASTQRRGGMVVVEQFNAAVQVNTKANMTAGTTLLGPVNGQFALGAKTAVDTLAHIAELCAVANETSDTSSTAAVKSCDFRL